MKKLLITLSILIILSIAGVFAIKYYIDGQYIMPRNLPEEQIILIERGDTINTVAKKLQLTEDQTFWFTKIARIKGRDKDIKTGEFSIPAIANIKQLLDAITSNDTISYKVTIIEGYQKYQIPTIFVGIDNLAGDMPEITQEGIYMPDTYYYKSGHAKSSILQRAQTAMEEYLDNAWQNKAKDLPIKTKEEALILASVVEKETSQDDEYKLVASVFMNRLNKGMKLQADSTSIYGITNGEKKFNRKLYTGDLAKKNEFNTYYIKGLPKRPICNPSRQAIDAVMHPAETDYLYFVADGTGGHVFAKTGKEHDRNVIKWRKIKYGK